MSVCYNGLGLNRNLSLHPGPAMGEQSLNALHNLMSYRCAYICMCVGLFLTCGWSLHELIHGGWWEVHRFPLVCGSGNGSSDSVWSHKAAPAGRPLPRGRFPASSIRSHLPGAKKHSSVEALVNSGHYERHSKNTTYLFLLCFLDVVKMRAYLQKTAPWVVHWSELPAPYQSAISKPL